MLKAAHEVVRIMIVSRLRQWFWNQSHVVQVRKAPPLAVFPCQSVPSMTPASLDDQTPPEHRNQMVAVVEEPTGVNDPVDLPPFHRDGA